MTREELQQELEAMKAFSPKGILYRTLFVEARGEPLEAQVGVGCVIRSRVADPRWPETYAEVCLQPAQFSGFNLDDPNLPKALDPEAHEKLEVLQQLRWVAQGIVEDLLRDNVAGANHYYDLSIILGQEEERDPGRVVRYLHAVDIILSPARSFGFAPVGPEDRAAARRMIHDLVAPLPPRWDNEVIPVARKGRLVFFKL